MATITSDHKFSSPEQHNLILLFQDQESKMVSLAKVKVEFLLELWRAIHLQASSKSPHASVGLGPLLLFKASSRKPSNPSQFRHSFIRTRRIIQDNLTSKSLVTPVNAFILLLFKTTHMLTEGSFYVVIFFGVDMCATELVWRSEDSFVESVFSFHLYMGCGD